MDKSYKEQKIMKISMALSVNLVKTNEDTRRRGLLENFVFEHSICVSLDFMRIAELLRVT